MKAMHAWFLPVTLALFALSCFFDLHFGIHDELSSVVGSTNKASKTSPSATAPPLSSMFVPWKNETRFIFVLGLEGAGHHALSSLLKMSPTTKLLGRLDLRQKLRRLEYSFFYAGHGLMDAYCHSTYPINATEKMNAAINAMQSMNRIIERHGSHPDIVINANGVNKMLSYPTGGRGECGRLKAPSLDLLYEVCHRARVRCEHIFLHRDPLDIMRSTTIKRPFNTDIHSGLHLYNAFIHVFYGYLSMYPTRTAGCVGLFEQNMTDQWRVVQELGSWSDEEDDFRQVASEVYAPPVAVSTEDAHLMVPDFAYGPNLRAMMRSHNAWLDLCHQQVERRLEDSA